MSIIYDALKKVERADINRQATNSAPRKSKPGLNIKILVIYLIAICISIVLANRIFVFLSVSPNKISSPRISSPLASSIASSRAPEPKTIPDVPVKSLPVFILNGVFFSGGEGYALIDNQVVKKGDRVNGAIVQSITMDEVDLLDRSGSTINLYTTH